MSSSGNISPCGSEPQVINQKTGVVTLLNAELLDAPFESSPSDEIFSILCGGTPRTPCPTPLKPVKVMFPFPEKELTERKLYVPTLEQKGIKVVQSDVMIAGLGALQNYLHNCHFPLPENDDNNHAKHNDLTNFFQRLLAALIDQEVREKEKRMKRIKRRKAKETEKMARWESLKAARLDFENRRKEEKQRAAMKPYILSGKDYCSSRDKINKYWEDRRRERVDNKYWEDRTRERAEAREKVVTREKELLSNLDKESRGCCI